MIKDFEGLDENGPKASKNSRQTLMHQLKLFQLIFSL